MYILYLQFWMIWGSLGSQWYCQSREGNRLSFNRLRDAFKKIAKFRGFVLNWLNPYPPLPIWEIKILDFLVGNWTLDHLPPLLIWDILSNGGCGDVGGAVVMVVLRLRWVRCKGYTPNVRSIPLIFLYQYFILL